MTWLRAANEDDVFEDEMVPVRVAGLSVLLVRLADGLHAYEDRCTHLGHPLSRGKLDACVLTCALHGWSFDARSGKSVNPRGEQLVPLRVKVADGQIFIAADGAGGRAG